MTANLHTEWSSLQLRLKCFKPIKKGQNNYTHFQEISLGQHLKNSEP